MWWEPQPEEELRITRKSTQPTAPARRLYMYNGELILYHIIKCFD